MCVLSQFTPYYSRLYGHCRCFTSQCWVNFFFFVFKCYSRFRNMRPSSSVWCVCVCVRFTYTRFLCLHPLPLFSLARLFSLYRKNHGKLLLGHEPVSKKKIRWFISISKRDTRQNISVLWWKKRRREKNEEKRRDDACNPFVYIYTYTFYMGYIRYIYARTYKTLDSTSALTHFLLLWPSQQEKKEQVQNNIKV